MRAPRTPLIKPLGGHRSLRKRQRHFLFQVLPLPCHRFFKIVQGRLRPCCFVKSLKLPSISTANQKSAELFHDYQCSTKYKLPHRALVTSQKQYAQGSISKESRATAQLGLLWHRGTPRIAASKVLHPPQPCATIAAIVVAPQPCLHVAQFRISTAFPND